MRKHLFTAITCLSIVLASCNSDNEPEVSTNKRGTVRYEASVSDPTNYKIKVLYTVGVDVSIGVPEKLTKEIIVESPFTFEQEAKFGTYLWVSVYPIPKSESLENLQKPKKVEVKMYIDNKLHDSHSGENYAMVQYIFGQDDL